MKVEDFDTYDQTMLRSAVKSGHLYAKVVEGPDGCWVSFISQDDPVNVLDRSEHRFAKIVRLDEIVGLTESVPHV